MISLNSKIERKGGFTLLELLIVISIIAILSIALVFMLNPAETLKKARDAQRISDLKTVKTALGIMLTASSTPSLDSGLATCFTTTTGVASAQKIAYSSSPTVFTGSTANAGIDAVVSNFTTPNSGVVTAASSGLAGKVDGTGWIPVKLTALTGGTPISNFPIDPVNTIAVVAAATSTDYVYRYACQNLSLVAGKPSYVFEIDAALESSAYTVDDDKRAKDGGDNASYYEAGNSLNLLPTSGNF